MLIGIALVVIVVIALFVYFFVRNQNPQKNDGDSSLTSAKKTMDTLDFARWLGGSIVTVVTIIGGLGGDDLKTEITNMIGGNKNKATVVAENKTDIVVENKVSDKNLVVSTNVKESTQQPLKNDGANKSDTKVVSEKQFPRNDYFTATTAINTSFNVTSIDASKINNEEDGIVVVQALKKEDKDLYLAYLNNLIIPVHEKRITDFGKARKAAIEYHMLIKEQNKKVGLYKDVMQNKLKNASLTMACNDLERRHLEWSSASMKEALNEYAINGNSSLFKNSLWGAYSTFKEAEDRCKYSSYLIGKDTSVEYFQNYFNK